jgi:hypothetical protein
MNSRDILYSPGSNDECYTPGYGVIPIISFIPPGAVVWCPFDKDDSNFVKLITMFGNKVVFSHIDYGQDFYHYEPDESWDVIVSNPPFTNKRLIFERALSFGKPIALIAPCTWLNDSGSKKAFLNTGRKMQQLLFNNRIIYTGPNGQMANKITFSSMYLCSDFLPKDIILWGDLKRSL